MDEGWESCRSPRSLRRPLKGREKAEAQRGQAAPSRSQRVTTEPDSVPSPVHPLAGRISLGDATERNRAAQARIQRANLPGCRLHSQTSSKKRTREILLLPDPPPCWQARAQLPEPGGKTGRAKWGRETKCQENSWLLNF